MFTTKYTSKHNNALEVKFPLSDNIPQQGLLEFYRLALNSSGAIKKIIDEHQMKTTQNALETLAEIAVNYGKEILQNHDKWQNFITNDRLKLKIAEGSKQEIINYK